MRETRDLVLDLQKINRPETGRAKTFPLETNTVVGIRGERPRTFKDEASAVLDLNRLKKYEKAPKRKWSENRMRMS